MDQLLLLTTIIFLPTAGAIVIALDRRSDESARSLAVGVTVATFVLTLFLLNNFDTRLGEMQMAIKIPWISSWNIHYQLGVDGISLPLVLLTSLTAVLAMLASGCIKEQVRGYLVLFLILETGMLGVFLALDFVLFYVFWELMLLPMYFLIGLWGGPRRDYAAIKFFLYTLIGGVLMLVALLMLYFGSQTERTFDLVRLAEIGQGRAGAVTFSPAVQQWAFVLLFLGFAIKMPIVPFHTWLPDAHVEAPTPISMILAGVLLKMGGYGLMRVAFPVCPLGAQWAAWTLVLMGVINILFGAMVALAQTDFKRLVAYSSISHMGYVLLGMAVWRLNEQGQTVGPDLWRMGMQGALFQMVSHGITSAGMFFLVGVIYDRVHHRDLDRYGGLMSRMPDYGGLAIVLFFAAMGLPGLCGFIGELFTVLAAWNFSPTIAVLSAFGVVLAAGYILWMFQRVFLGSEYRGPHEEALTPLNGTEALIGSVLLILAVLFGIFPDLLLSTLRESVDLMVHNLTWATESAARVTAQAGP